VLFIARQDLVALGSVHSMRIGLANVPL
jgi:hypothetical protein